MRNNIIEFNIIVSLSSQHNPLFAQVSENYGQVFYFKSKQERQRELEARYMKRNKRLLFLSGSILLSSDIGSNVSALLAKMTGHS